MSIDIIGNELLPNVYIKNISIFDSTENFVSYTVDVCILDTVENSFWSNEDILMNYMIIKFVASEITTYDSFLSNGEADLSQDSINDFLGFEENIGKTIIMQKKRIAAAKMFVREGFAYYSHKFTFSLRKRMDETDYNLTIFAAASIDSKFLSENYNLDLLTENVSAYTGPISSERIYYNGSLESSSKAFIRPNGQQYIGPVHVHDNIHMEGSRHRQTPHDTLEVVRIDNQKIKDFRSYNFRKKDMIPTAAFTRSKIFFSKLYDSFDHKDGSVIGTFAANLYNILLNKTAYGKYLYNANDSLLKEVYDNFSFENFFFQRKKIELFPGGSRVIDKTNLTNSEDFVMQPVSYAQGNDNVQYYEFIDMTLNRNSPGFYKYELFFSMNDPTVMFVKNAIMEMRFSLSLIKQYLAQLSRKPHFDFDLKKTTPAFIDFVSLEYSSNQYKNAPFIVAFETFIKYKSFLYDIDNLQLIRNSTRSKLSPRTATVGSLRYFINEYEFLMHEFQNHFNFDTADLKDMNSLPVLKHRKNGILIELSHEFENVIQPMNNKTHYNFLKVPQNSDGPLIKVTPSEIIERIQKENNKFDGNISVEITSDIYLSPAEANKGKIKVDLSRISAIDTNSLAEIFIDDQGSALSVSELSADPEESQTPEVAPAPLNVRMPALMSSRSDTDANPTATLTTLAVTSPRASLENLMITPDNLSSITANIQTISEIVCEDNRDESIQTAFESFRNIVVDEGPEQFLITASKFLNSQSNFLDFTQKIENCSLPQDVYGAFIEKRLVLDSLLPERNNSLFDIKSKKSYLNDSSRTGITPSANELPEQIKSIFELPNINSIDDIDLSKFKLVREVNHFSLIKILVFRGFRPDPTFPRIPHLNEHVWSPIRVEDVTNLTRPLLCVMKYYSKAELDIQVKSITKLPIANKYFIISDQTDIQNLETNPLSYSEQFKFEESERYLISSVYDPDYTMSNIVQNSSTWTETDPLAENESVNNPTSDLSAPIPNPTTTYQAPVGARRLTTGTVMTTPVNTSAMVTGGGTGGGGSSGGGY